MATAERSQLTIELPPDLIEMLWTAATERRETPNQIVVEALRFSLQPVRQQALQRLNEPIRRQQPQPEREVRAHLDAHLNDTEQELLSQLLERNRAGDLSEEERADLATLFARIEAVATEKAAAIWLLSTQVPETDSPR